LTLSDWIISSSAGVIAIILGVATYFAQKWIQSVDETLKEHSSDFKTISKQIGSLESKQSTQAENIAKTIHTQLATLKFPHSKIDEINKEVGLIKSIVQDKLLPSVHNQDENYGRILVIEKSVGEQNEKLANMFSALKILVLKEKNPK
jgi:uncharacterized protein YoxC